MTIRASIVQWFARARHAVLRYRWQQDYEKSLNDRAEVEQQLLDVARGKVELPSREQCRKWAIKLGVPAHWRNDTETLALRELVDAAQQIDDGGGLWAYADGCGRIRKALAAYRRESAR